MHEKHKCSEKIEFTTHYAKIGKNYDYIANAGYA